MQVISSLWLKPHWSLSETFIAGTTISHSPLAKVGFNLAQHVEDSPSRVKTARALLSRDFPPQAQFLWLNQIHSNVVISHEDYAQNYADAAISCNKNAIPVVMTADCLPIIVGAKDGSQWAAIHAGWQGLYKNIIAQTIAKFTRQENLSAWIGPCIRQQSYEVDAEFFQRFETLDPRFIDCFLGGREGHYFADLPAIARIQLQDCGVSEISDCGICSFTDQRFFSYRRNGKDAGRMATFITVRDF